MLGEMIARGVLDNLYRFVVPAVAEPASLVPLAALASDASDEVSTVALRTAAIRGRLKAVHSGDGQWRSNRLWVDEYLASQHQRLGS